MYAYSVHVQLYTLYENIVRLAEDNGFEITDFGAYALDSMRMEVGFKFLGSDMRKDDTAVMASLEKFIKFKNRGYFRGRDVCERELKEGVPRKLYKMEVDILDADAYGDNPIFTKQDDKLVGWTASGADSHQSDRSLAFGYLYEGYQDSDTELYVELVGEKRPIRVLVDSQLK